MGEGGCDRSTDRHRVGVRRTWDDRGTNREPTDTKRGPRNVRTDHATGGFRISPAPFPGPLPFRRVRPSSPYCSQVLGSWQRMSLEVKPPKSIWPYSVPPKIVLFGVHDRVAVRTGFPSFVVTVMLIG